MQIVKWAPWQELDTFERRMRRMLEDVGFAPALIPAADVYETGDEFVVELEVPGYEEKELALEVTDHTLTIKGERKALKDENEKAFRLHERLEHTFERRFSLPIDIDTKHLKATFTKGVIEVHAPKIQAVKPRKIELTTK